MTVNADSGMKPDSPEWRISLPARRLSVRKIAKQGLQPVFILCLPLCCPAPYRFVEIIPDSMRKKSRQDEHIASAWESVGWDNRRTLRHFDTLFPKPTEGRSIWRKDVSIENNRSVAERFVQAINSGDMDAAAECFAEDACNFGRPVGREGIPRVLRGTSRPSQLETVDVVAEGDWVVERGYLSATHRGIGKLPVNGGLLVGVSSINRQFRVNHAHMYRMNDLKIIDHYGLRDDLGMMQQLGLLPMSEDLIFL